MSCFDTPPGRLTALSPLHVESAAGRPGLSAGLSTLAAMTSVAPPPNRPTFAATDLAPRSAISMDPVLVTGNLPPLQLALRRLARRWSGL